MSFFLISFLFCFFLNFINSSHVSIPFKVQNFTYEDKKEFIYRYIYKDILVNFLVGSPPQNVRLSINLGEYSTFIIAKDAYGYRDSTFDKDKSETYKALSGEDFYYYQTYREAIKSTDDFIVQGPNSEYTKYNNISFCLATDIQEGSSFCYYCEILTEPGMLGLMIGQTKMSEENIYEMNFIGQLKNNSIISSYDFFFDFNKNDTGNLIIGIRPDEYYQSEKYKKLKYVTIKTSLSHNDIEWCIDFDQVHYGEKKMEVKPSQPMILRIEFGLIIGYPEWEYTLKDNFFNDLINNNTCFLKNATGHDPRFRYNYYYCNKNVNLDSFKPFTFTINEYNYNFTLTKEDLFFDDGDKYVFLMTFGGMEEFVLGLPFFKRNQLIFNQDTKTLGFYINKTDENENSLTKYIIIISVLGIILIGLTIFIIWYIKNKKKKIKATELLDDNENENKIIEENPDGRLTE